MKRNSSLTPAIILGLIGIFSKSPVFFVIAFFFLMNYLMNNNKQQNNRDARSRRNQQRPRKGRDYREQRRYEPQPQQQRRQEPIRKTQFRVRSNPFKKSGLKKYKEFDIDEAIIDFQKGLEIEPKDIALHFNLACAYSISEEKEKSFFHLSEAVKYGFKDFEKIQTHDDLAFIRIQNEFDDFKSSGYRFSTAKRIEVKEDNIQDDVLLSQLNKLAELRKKGLLSQDEFVLEKEKLLRG